MNETSIQFNSSQVFKYFSYLISDLRNFDRFCEYLLSIRGKFKLRSLLSTIFYEVGYSLDNNCEYDYMLYLPEVFYKELWRGQNLVLDLLKSEVRTIKSLREKVVYWTDITLDSYCIPFNPELI